MLPTETQRRQAFVRAALALWGTPYIYGGKSPAGIDCSGLVTCALQASGGPDWRLTHNAQRIRTLLPVLSEREAQPGDLIFFGEKDGTLDHAEHVVIYVGRGVVIGANGGGKACNTLEVATRLGAGVRFELGISYRRRLLDVRRCPALVGT